MQRAVFARLPGFSSEIVLRFDPGSSPTPGADGTNDTSAQERHAEGYGNSISVQYLLSIAMISTKFTNVTGLSR